MGTSNLIAHYTGLLVESAVARGLPLEELCRAAGVTQSALPPQANMVTPETFGRISRTVKEQLNDEFCGFTAARCRARTLPFIFDTIIREDTLGDALNAGYG